MKDEAKKEVKQEEPNVDENVSLTSGIGSLIDEL